MPYRLTDVSVRRGNARNWRRIWMAAQEDASGNRWKDFEVGDGNEAIFLRLLDRTAVHGSLQNRRHTGRMAACL